MERTQRYGYIGTPPYTPHLYTPHPLYTPHLYTPHLYTPPLYTPHLYTPPLYTPPLGANMASTESQRDLRPRVVPGQCLHSSRCN